MPEEIHETYDPEGALLTRTVVTRESAWDDDSREAALALLEYEDGMCQCGCGTPVAQAYDPKQAFLVDHVVCQAGRAIAQVKRRKGEERKDAPEGWDDGFHYYAKPVTDDRTKRGARGN